MWTGRLTSSMSPRPLGVFYRTIGVQPRRQTPMRLSPARPPTPPVQRTRAAMAFPQATLPTCRPIRADPRGQGEAAAPEAEALVFPAAPAASPPCSVLAELRHRRSAASDIKVAWRVATGWMRCDADAAQRTHCNGRGRE